MRLIDSIKTKLSDYSRYRNAVKILKKYDGPPKFYIDCLPAISREVLDAEIDAFIYNPKYLC